MNKTTNIKSTLKIFLLAFILFTTSCKDSEQEIFRDFFEFAPPPDVKDFHYFPQEGFNSEYWIAFKCDTATVEKIRATLDLVPDNHAGSGLMSGLNFEPTEWWDYEFITNSVPYIKNVYSSHYFLWYDRAKGKAYFLLYNS